MQIKSRKKISSFILCIMLIVATALSTTGCNDSTGNTTPSSIRTKESVQTEGDIQTKNGAQTEGDAQTKDRTQTEENVLGEGNTKFTFLVVDKEGSETQFEIHTDKETVGEALMELGLIDGEEGKFGIYVKTVNGITIDYDTDGVYWAFYINDEYALTGIDTTKITEGDRYSFKVE